jgi:segregation and condensation protein B
MGKEINIFEDELGVTPSQMVSKETSEKPVIIQTSFLEDFEEQKAEATLKVEVDEETKSHVKRIIEAVLFASSDPVSFERLREIIDSYKILKPRHIKAILDELNTEYLVQQRAFRLDLIANGYVLRSSEEYRKYIDLLYRDKRAEKLTQASMEVLAIIAYRQPITRPQIEAIRGVDSSGTIQSLLERKLIEEQGRLEAPGRPTLFGITKDFLKHFGLKDLQELPKLEW